jgi:hypothetical protein
MPEETTKKNSLDDYTEFLYKNPSSDTKDFDNFIELHREDKYSAKDVEEKFGTKFGEISGNVIAFIISLMMKQAALYTSKIIEFVHLHRLNDEALPNIKFRKSKLKESIAKKWEKIQELYPETKSFTKEKYEEEFNKWESNISPEEKKSLKEKYRITLNNGLAYKKISDGRQNNMAEKTPSLIFKLYTRFFHPTPTTSAITKQGKTDQEYSRQFYSQSSSTKKSILRHEKKLTKRKKEKSVAKKPTGYREKFKKMYAYLFNLKNTPIEYATADVASQEINKSKKKENEGNTDLIWPAVVAEELTLLAPPPAYNPLPSDGETTINPEEPPPSYSPTNPTPTHSSSSMQRQLSSLQNQRNNNPLHSRHLSKLKKSAAKRKALRRAGSRKAVEKAAGKKTWWKRPIFRCVCCPISCLGIVLVIFLAIIIAATGGIVLGLF